MVKKLFVLLFAVSLITVFSQIALEGAASAELAAEILELGTVPNTPPGGDAYFQAKVKNTGSVTFPDGTEVIFHCAQLGDGFVFVDCPGIVPGATEWFGISVHIPDDSEEGVYCYSAGVWDRSEARWISAWSIDECFLVNNNSSCMSCHKNNRVLHSSPPHWHGWIQSK